MRVVWSRALGQGYSAFAVSEGRLYTLFQDLFGQYLVCLTAATGDEVWRMRYDAPYDTIGIYPGPRGTPTMADGRIYFVSPDAVAWCVSATTGEQIWQLDLHERFGTRGVEFGYAASAVVLDGRVYLPVGGPQAGVVALNAHTGQPVWTATNDSASYCTILPISLDGRPILVCYLENAACLLDPADGNVLWRVDLSTGYDEHSAAPLYEEPLLVFTAPFRAGADTYRLTWRDPATRVPDRLQSVIVATPVWNTEKFSNDVTSSVVVEGALFGFDLRDAQSKAHRPSRGEFRCLDLLTGEILWSSAEPGQSNVLAAGKSLLLWNDRGELIVADARRDGYFERGRLPVFPDEICWSSPAFTDGRVYLRSQSKIACVAIDVIQPATGNTHRLPVTAPGPIRRLNLQALLGGEREHPFMRPTLEELRDWFLAGLAALVTAALSIGLIALVLRLLARPLAVDTAARSYCVAAILSAFIATPFLNRFELREFLFTWPAVLTSSFQWVLLENALRQRRPLGSVTAPPPAVGTAQAVDAALAVERPVEQAAVSAVGNSHAGDRDPGRAWMGARLVDLLFLVVCGGYFWLLHRLSLPHEWVFLAGFPAATGPCWAAARAVARAGPVRACLWHLVGYAAGFWFSALLPALLDQLRH